MKSSWEIESEIETFKTSEETIFKKNKSKEG
jgi:hypothetical protein